LAFVIAPSRNPIVQKARKDLRAAEKAERKAKKPEPEPTPVKKKKGKK
jgi:hypothetical protein